MNHFRPGVIAPIVIRLMMIVFSLLLAARSPLFACHRGGAMGFAHKDPGMMSVDITFSPTFAFASTSGTSGCKNWDYTAQLHRHFIESQWTVLDEEAARGKGVHLHALAGMMGCETAQHPRFIRLVREKYSGLFIHSLSGPVGKDATMLLGKLKNLVRNDERLQCSLDG